MPNAPFLVVAAASVEIRPFVRSLNGARATVETLVTGIGKASCHRAVTRRLREGRYRAVVSAGFAGGTRPGLKTGDLLVASAVVDAASGRRFTPSPVAITEGAGFFRGLLVTAEKIQPDPDSKKELGRRLGAVAVDMETAAVAQVAQELGLPWVALRAILDPMEERLCVTSAGKAAAMALSPSGLRQLLRFFTCVRTAGHSLARGLPLVCGERLGSSYS